jgi:tRNA (cmo5U34)-methyltransferase
MNVGASFAADAEIYDRSRRQLIPCFDDFYRTAVELAPQAHDAAIEVLDLGAGTGLLSAFFADAYRNARLTLVDVAPEMLRKARERFVGRPGRFTFRAMDYISEPFEATYDLIVSCLSIHHLEDDAKADLFRKVHAALNPGGAFINADEVLGATAAVAAWNHASWLAHARASGALKSDVDASLERMKHDRLATLADQLGWLREAGFRDVDCAYKYQMFVVYSGVKS